jgi:hypothetical protein
MVDYNGNYCRLQESNQEDFKRHNSLKQQVVTQTLVVDPNNLDLSTTKTTSTTVIFDCYFPWKFQVLML